jgi:hypothetical protein
MINLSNQEIRAHYENLFDEVARCAPGEFACGVAFGLIIAEFSNGSFTDPADVKAFMEDPAKLSFADGRKAFMDGLIDWLKEN